MGRLKLFDDDDQIDDVSKIEINKEYAKRLEHNKKREELQRYEELKKKGVIAESDEESDDESIESEEDNDDLVGSSKGDLEFFNALLLVKKKDPSLREKDVKLFGSESDGSEQEEEEEDSKNEEETGKKKKNKAMYLKDVMAKHLMEEGPEFEEEKEEFGEKKKKKKSYSEEQEEIRKAFLEAVKEAEVNEQEEDDGFLKEKKKENDDEGDVEDDDNEQFVKKLDEYFGGDGELDENKLFLKEFFKNKMWVDKEKNEEVGIDEEEVEDLLREDEELERQEQYEVSFRHEEGVDDRVMGHSRKVEGSVRKKENARKEQRKSKEERMKIAEMERKEELKHLKNLKKKEMKERMKKVMAIAGFKEDENLPLSLRDLDDEFDPEEYDRMMKAVFDDKYYDAEDVEPGFGSGREEDEDGIEKPDFDKEDELLGLPKGWDVIESGDGFKSARERSLKRKLESVEEDDDNEGESMEEDDNEGEGMDEDDNEGESEEEDDDNKAERVEGKEEEEVYEESKRKRKRKMSLVKRAREEMLEEFYKLDYEDTIGDLKTRFKYAKVKPNRFGLKSEELLMLDDKELNQYVSVKKLAPYREKEWKVPDSVRHQQKLKIKELLRGRKSDGQKSGKKKKSKNDAGKSTSVIDAKADEKAQQEVPNSDMGNLSKRAKTRRRQAKPKLSQSRLIAYGKIPSKAKSN